jgi:hypothetical protein
MSYVELDLLGNQTVLSVNDYVYQIEFNYVNVA